MDDMTFSTDPSLCISAWGTDIAALTGRVADSVIGTPYHEVLPHLLVEGRDALIEAARLRESLVLKNYRINCLYSSITADITIEPQFTSAKELQGIVVTVAPSTACAIAAKLSRSEQLIRIGRIASSLAHGVRNPLNAIK